MPKGFLNSKYRVQKSKAVQNLETLNKGQIQVPKWTVVIGTVAFLASAGLLAGTLIVATNKQRDGLYNESCATRTCAKGLGLKCLNKTCLCPTDQFYREKCRNLSTHDEPCRINSECLQNQFLICKIDSKCGCDSDKYWNQKTKMCLNRKTFSESCDGDQCKKSLDLHCSSSICNCTNTQTLYWNGSKCVPKKNYYDNCTSTSQCLDSEETLCLNSLCSCTSSEYFSVSSSKCVPRKNEFELCSFDEMCLRPMFCSIRVGCRCPSYNYFSSSTSTCTNQFMNGVTCTSTNQCRSDLGLSCTNSKCSCNSPTHTWSSVSYKCLITYKQFTCSVNSNCNDAENLICQTNSMCDCNRTIGNENFWDGSKCAQARSYLLNCSFDYQCQTLTQKTLCLLGVCSCVNLSIQYWSGSECLAKKKYNETCSKDIECLDAELTYCRSNRCGCTDRQYFSLSQRRCVSRVGELQSCFSNDMCFMNMVCNTTHCLCTGNKFYENTTSLCTNQFSFNEYCDRNLECRNDLGLSCINNRCVCSSSKHTWSSSAKKCLLTYGEKFCVSDSDCNESENLKCVMESCNCPKTSSIGMCDCKRVNGNENYWQSNQCTEANGYGRACSFNYECKTLTEKTVCSNGFCVCSNSSLEYWSGTECKSKKRQLESCTRTIECLDSDLTFCNGSRCVCQTGQYYSEIQQKCVPRVGEFEPCVNRTMCLEAMICHSSLSICMCQSDEYFENTTAKCFTKKSINFYCDRNMECSEQKGLVCTNNKCVCSNPSHTWDSNQSKCRLTYSKSSCSLDSDCNLSESLSCRDSSSSRCACPLSTAGNICDCKRTSGSEQFWDGTKCTRAKAYGSSCNFTYECRTLEEKTICSNNICQCDTNGEYVTNICKYCRSDELLFQSKCYYFSLLTETDQGHNIDDRCSARGGSREAYIPSLDVLNFFRLQINGTERYWLRRREFLVYEWRNTGVSISSTLCSYSSSFELFFNFDPVIDCYRNDKSSSNPYPYVCENNISNY